MRYIYYNEKENKIEIHPDLMITSNILIGAAPEEDFGNINLNFLITSLCYFKKIEVTGASIEIYEGPSENPDIEHIPNGNPISFETYPST